MSQLLHKSYKVATSVATFVQILQICFPTEKYGKVFFLFRKKRKIWKNIFYRKDLGTNYRYRKPRIWFRKVLQNKNLHLQHFKICLQNPNHTRHGPALTKPATMQNKRVFVAPEPSSLTWSDNATEFHC